MRKVRIAGWGQVTQRKDQVEGLLGPLGLMAEASRRAADEAGEPGSLADLDALFVVRVMSRAVPRAAARLAARLGAAPRLAEVSAIGGNSPQGLVERAADLVRSGEAERILVAGAETYCRRGARKPPGESPLFQGLEEGPDRDDMVGSTELERRHGVALPIHGFPLFETALWAESGLDLEAYLSRLAERWSGFSRVAAEHPFAWTSDPRSAAEIATQSADNRPIAFPYLKLMNPLVGVDMGAAVLVTSEEAVRRRRGRRPVYFLGGASTVDRQRFLVERSSFTRSQALCAAVDRALARAGLDLSEVGCFDLYSCFPSAVEIARRELCLADDDPRPVTLTGGLGFFGGPGNDYGLHAIATLAEEIASGRRETGLVTGLGWFLHKHAAGLYGAEPGSGHRSRVPEDPAVGEPPLPIAERPSGFGTIETYTVFHSRAGEPTGAVLYGRTEAGLRFVAAPLPDPGAQARLKERCCVGHRVRLRPDEPTNRTLAELVDG